ncbi:MAG: TolC family protein [Candidatus Zixiibacteriota bacterium]
MCAYHKTSRARYPAIILPAMLIALTALLFLPSTGFSEALTLQDALQIALENSPSIRQARNSLESAEASLNAEEASLKSQFRFDLTPFSLVKDRTVDAFTQEWYTAETQSSAARFSVNQRLKWTDASLTLANNFDWSKTSSERENIGKFTRTTYRNSLSFGLSQPLFTYNRTRHTLSSLELSYENSRINYAIQKLQIELRVTRAFYDVYQNRMSLNITQEEYRNKQESYDIIKNKVEAGISAKEELFQAEINQASSKAQLKNSQVSYEDALDNLKILLGLSLHDEIEVLADVGKFVVEVDLDKAVESGLQYRMELRQREIAIENARLSLVTVGAVDEFKGSVSLNYGLLGTEENLSDIYKSPLKSQSISVEFNIPIWDWGRKNSSLRASELQLDNQVISRDEEQKQVELGIRQSYRSLQNQLTQIEIAEKSIENARLTYEINLERYKNGDISSKDIGEFQNQLSREQYNHIAALINYRIALLNLKIESLWDFENDRPVLDIG